jgi:hypothetical protein
VNEKRRSEGRPSESRLAAKRSNLTVQSIRIDDDPALFESEYVRGPGPRPATTGPLDSAARSWWWTEAERIVLALVASGHCVTSDDLHERFPDEPSASGAACGGLFAWLARAGHIVEVGMVKSRRPEA